MDISRRAELALLRLSEEFPALLVTGPRQSGKSTLLLKAFPGVDYVTFDDPYEVIRAKGSPKSFLEQFTGTVILDEVQYVPELFRYLKLFIDRDRRNGKYLLTGSQVFELAHLGSESLAGRLGLLELGPLSGDEIEGTMGTQPLIKHIFAGGFPEIWGRAANPVRWFPAYISTYLSRDIRQLSQVADLVTFSRFLRSLALRTGSLVNFSDLSRDVGIAPNTAKNWVSLLVSSGIGFLVEGWSSNPGSRLVKAPKFYFGDSGLLVSLLNLMDFSVLEGSPHLGAVWETWCFAQIRIFLSSMGAGSGKIFYWRTKEGKEVDFLVDFNGLTAFECKARELPEKKDTANFSALLKQGGVNINKSAVLCMSPGYIPRIPDTLSCADNGLHLDKIFLQAEMST